MVFIICFLVWCFHCKFEGCYGYVFLFFFTYLDMIIYHLMFLLLLTDSDVPELLPIGYLVGDTTQIGICLKGK